MVWLLTATVGLGVTVRDGVICEVQEPLAPNTETVPEEAGLVV